MLSAASIQHIVREGSEAARKAGLVPTDLRSLDLAKCPPFPFHFLGDYVPEGWEVARDADGEPITLLCDSSGWGSADEPALTPRQLVQRLRTFKLSGDPYGVGIVEQGQFQVVVGVFRVDRRDWTGTGKLLESEYIIGRN